MIHDVDEALRKLVLQYAVNGSGVEVSFDAPTKDWAARRNAPTVNVYLYDVREDLDRREVGSSEIRDDTGRVTERRPPPRRYKLSYLVTCWTQRPEDEHRLLSSLLGLLPQVRDACRARCCSGCSPSMPQHRSSTIALPPPKDRSLADVWSALGGELKPSLDLVVTAPFDAARVAAAGPPVLEEPRIARRSPQQRREPRGAAASRRAAKGAHAAAEPRAERRRRADETIEAGTEKQPGQELDSVDSAPADELSAETRRSRISSAGSGSSRRGCARRSPTRRAPRPEPGRSVSAGLYLSEDHVERLLAPDDARRSLARDRADCMLARGRGARPTQPRRRGADLRLRRLARIVRARALGPGAAARRARARPRRPLRAALRLPARRRDSPPREHRPRARARRQPAAVGRPDRQRLDARARRSSTAASSWSRSPTGRS